jgi:hypothetical protein
VIQVDRWLAAAAWFRDNGWRIGVVYVLAAVVIVCMPSLGTLIGSKEAKEDRYFTQSTLPKLYKIVGTGGVQEPCDNCLLLLMDSSEIVYFSGIPLSRRACELFRSKQRLPRNFRERNDF